MEDWQEKLLVDIESGGLKPGEMVVMMAGRRTGKSVFQRLWNDIYNANRPIEDLVLTEQPVHGAKYYCVEPVGGSWADMEAWAKQSFGECSEVWDIKDSDPFLWPECGRWYMNNRKFWFRNEKDRTMFIMRWSR